MLFFRTDAIPPSGPSVDTPPPFYRSALSTLQSIQGLSVALDIRDEPVIRLVEALTAVLVPSGRVSQQQAFPWTAMTPERFPGHLRDFSWERKWAILPTKDRLERWGLCSNAQCANCDFSPETTEHVVQDCSASKGFWRLVSRVFFVTTAAVLASRR